MPERLSSRLALLVFLWCLIGCERRPEVCFDVDRTDWLVANREIQFTDCSLRGDSWYWDFGDGTSSRDRNPVKKYLVPGTYQVTHMVWNEDLVDSVSVEFQIKRAFFKSITLLDIPDTKPNGDPWDPDLSGPDVYLHVYDYRFRPGVPCYIVQPVRDIQDKLPYTVDVTANQIGMWGENMTFLLVNVSNGSDTIVFWAPFIPDMIASPRYTRNFGDSLGFHFEFFAD